MRKDFRTQNLLSEFALNPQFVEHDGCIFLMDGFSDESYQKWLHFYEGLGMGKSAVESLMNHRHIPELFVNTVPEPSRRLANEAGMALKKVWRTRLKIEFPDREFVVKYFPDEPPSSSEITFCQKSPRSK